MAVWVLGQASHSPGSRSKSLSRSDADQYATPEYGHFAFHLSQSGAGGMQSMLWGQLASCSQPQPHAFENGVVLGGQAYLMVMHSYWLLPT